MKDALFYNLGCRKCAAMPVSLVYETRARDRRTAVLFGNVRKRGLRDIDRYGLHMSNAFFIIVPSLAG